MTLPASSRYVIVGAGIHGLSTGYHLAKELKSRRARIGRRHRRAREVGARRGGLGDRVRRRPEQLLPAGDGRAHAGVRRGLGVRPGRVSLQPGRLHGARPVRCRSSDLIETYERQERIGYRSTLVTGAGEVDAYMKQLFPDWRAKGVTALLHEHQGGFAFNLDSVMGLVGKCRSEGVEILTGVEVKAFEFNGDESVRAVVTSQGTIEVGEQLVLAPGPWAKHVWSMLELPPTIDVRTPSGEVVPDRPMWTYWNLQEGEIQVDPQHLRARRRRRPAGHPPRHGRAAPHGRGRARDRRALGDLLQARPPRRAGRRLAARRRGRTSSSTPTRRPPTSIRTSRTCGAPRSPMP